MKVLLHTCCAPCSIKCIDIFKAEDIEPVIFWYNPNIHPYIEYKNRQETLKEYVNARNLQSVFINEYGLRNFINEICPDFENRCEKCYHIRLETAARYASVNGFDAFSTTLLISPYQNHELIIKTAQKLAVKYNVEFLYRDFRPYFREGQKIARELGMYMQKYCGCIFSEEERYLNKKK